MSCCKTHIRRINPVDGTSVVYDVTTGAVVTEPAILERLECCPDRTVDKESVCLQVIGNTDPNDIEKGWSISTLETDASGLVTVVSSALYDQALAVNLTDTHEVVECPDMTPIDVALCLGVE